MVGGLFYEIKYRLTGLVFLIKDYLSVLVLPIKGEVRNANLLEPVGDLTGCAVYDVSYFVGYYELDVLSR